MKIRQSLLLAIIVMGLPAAAAAAAGDGTRIPPVSQSLGLKSLADVPVSEVAAVDREALRAEDAARPDQGRAPFRFAVLDEVALSPGENGRWRDLPDGGRLWRLRVHAPGATDLNFGFSRFQLPAGAMLHVIGEANGFFQGPYTDRQNRPHGELWSAVVPGDRAVVELYVPAAAEVEPELELAWVGRGYRDLFKRDTSTVKQGSCNIDVACPEGNDWRDEVRSVGAYSYRSGTTQYFCTGTLIANSAGFGTPYFLSAWHCGVNEAVDQSVVVYWNNESPTCGQLGGGSLEQNQSGAIFRASLEEADVVLLELEETPDESFNVYYAGWDARSSLQPRASVSIHHPGFNDEKAIALNDDPLSTIESLNLVDGEQNLIGTILDPWRVDNWEQGTTEAGSSGAGLWDPETRRIVGVLSGGSASCANPSGADYYGNISKAWDGADAASRLKDWLDPGDTGTLVVEGLDPAGGEGGNVASCGNAFYDDGSRDGTTYFGGGKAGDPNYMYGVWFRLADFGFTPGSTQITKFCVSNQAPFEGGPWPNQVFIYPDDSGFPDDSVILGQGTVYTGDGLGWYEVTLDAPATLDGDFWLFMRGDPRWEGEDFNMDYDGTVFSGQSLWSDSGIDNLRSIFERNYMIRATLEATGGNGYGDGAYNYHVGAIVHSKGVGDAFFRTKMGLLNLAGSSATVTLTYFWNNGPTTVARTVAGGRLQTWDDVVLSLFGLGQNTSGSVLVNSTQPLIVTTRTYTSDDKGTFGSFMPGVEVSDGVAPGQTGILSQLTGNSDFRTNVGVVNLSDASCDARVRLKSVSGDALGSPKTLTLGPYKFSQINDVFAATGAGVQNDAYATVEALTAGCRVWAYASVIDGTNASPGTNDPTLIPLTVVE